jgi:maltooligosyltrehalose trehalohydrolase
MSSDHPVPAFGANLTDDGVRFAVWAPNAKERVTLEVHRAEGTEDVPMTPVGDGSYEAQVAGVGTGTRYAFRLDDGPAFPDPYSRYQPEGVHGLSEVVDPTPFAWTDEGWAGPDPEHVVVYELHVGTMTPEGTFAALTEQLPLLAELGVTMIELMPVAQTPGNRNWGYDGVDLFAPSNAYGTPDDLRRLVDTAHGLGLGVMLDVVYNHFGPEGAYQGAYAQEYFSDRHETDWGAGLNWDGPGSERVRRYAIDNARHWISEYHLDGLRLDATHAMVDDSDVHIVRELSEAARETAGSRRIIIHAEDGRHDITRARLAEQGGDGTDGVWADDFHHEVRVLLTNAHENYYADYSGSTASMAMAIEDGFSPVTVKKNVPAVEESDPAGAFVFCIQNHDQVGNRPFGDRLHHEIHGGRYAVASALLLFSPQTPLLFMGQEFAASTPFLYFTDHPEELGRLVTEGRRGEFKGFGVFSDEHLRETIPDPQAESTFLSSKLKLEERETNAGIYRLYRDLLAMRRDDPVLSQNDRSRTRAQALTSQQVAVQRWAGDEHRLLLANFGAEATVDLAVLEGLPEGEWRVLLNTTDRLYDGTGEDVNVSGRSVVIPARSAVVLWLGA